jgi:hypothetical protein
MIAESLVTSKSGKRWLMSQQEEDAILGQLLRERTAANQKLEKTKEKAVHIGRQFEGLGRLLQDDVQMSNISVDCYRSLLSEDMYQQLQALKPELDQIQADLARIAKRLEPHGL